METHGQDRTIDHVATCAGISSEDLDLMPVQPDDFIHQKAAIKAPASRSINMSINGTLYTVAAAMRYGMRLHKEEDMAARGDKSITVLSSMAGFASMPLQSDNTASKWGVRGLFRSLLDDRQANSSPVQFNLFAPYFGRTPLTESWVPYMEKIGIMLADIGDVLGAAMRFMCDKSVYGRSAGISQGGPVDLSGDFLGGFGSAALSEGIQSGAMVQSTATITQKRG
jgi:5'-hydroxyaverantin dehydrogenase